VTALRPGLDSDLVIAADSINLTGGLVANVGIELCAGIDLSIWPLVGQHPYEWIHYLNHTFDADQLDIAEKKIKGSR
jgi:hypothetical protein